MHALSAILSVLFINWRVLKLKGSGLVLSLVIPLFLLGISMMSIFQMWFYCTKKKSLMLTCLCLTHCMASFLYQNPKMCLERLHSTRTKLLHPRNTTYDWPNSHRKLCSRNWLIWNKMALQLQQRTPHWQLSYGRIMYIIYLPTFANLVLLLASMQI